MNLPVCCKSDPYCGFGPNFAQNMESITVEGNMAWEVVTVQTTPTIVQRLRATGTGKAIGLCPAHWQGGAVNMYPDVNDLYRSAQSPSTGKFWAGVLNGEGVMFDFATNLVTRVKIGPDGDVATVLGNVLYPKPIWSNSFGLPQFPWIFASWCPSSINEPCSRLHVGAYCGPATSSQGPQGDLSSLVILAATQVPSAVPYGDDIIMAWGTTVDCSTPRKWYVNPCGRFVCPPCQLNTFIAPRRARVTGLSGLSDINTGPRGNPNYVGLDGQIPTDGILQTAAVVDQAGREYAMSCLWVGGGPGGIIHPTLGTVLNDDETTQTQFGIYVQLKPERQTSPMCIDRVEGPWNPESWSLVVFVSLTQSLKPYLRDTFYTNNMMAVYQGVMRTDENPASFELAFVTHGAGGVYPPYDCSNSKTLPWVDPASFPSTVQVSWIITAPECDLDEPTPPGNVCGLTKWECINLTSRSFDPPNLVWKKSDSTCGDSCHDVVPLFEPSFVGQTTQTGCA